MVLKFDELKFCNKLSCVLILKFHKSGRQFSKGEKDDAEQCIKNLKYKTLLINEHREWFFLLWIAILTKFSLLQLRTPRGSASSCRWITLGLVGIFIV